MANFVGEHATAIYVICGVILVWFLIAASRRA